MILLLSFLVLGHTRPLLRISTSAFLLTSAVLCPKSIPDLSSPYQLTSTRSSFAALCFFFQVEPILRLLFVFLMCPFSGNGQSTSFVFSLSSDQIWQLFEFSCTSLRYWSCFTRITSGSYGGILFGKCLVFVWWYLSPSRTKNPCLD